MAVMGSLLEVRLAGTQSNGCARGRAEPSASRAEECGATCQCRVTPRTVQPNSDRAGELAIWTRLAISRSKGIDELILDVIKTGEWISAPAFARRSINSPLR